MDRFLAGPEHEAELRGEILCQELGGRLPVERGTFQLFVEHSDRQHLRMRYRLFFTDRAGHRLTLIGYKDVDEESGAESVAAGSVHIRLADFLKHLRNWKLSEVADTEGVEKRPVTEPPPTVRLIEEPVVVARHGQVCAHPIT